MMDTLWEIGKWILICLNLYGVYVVVVSAKETYKLFQKLKSFNTTRESAIKELEERAKQ